MPGKLMRYSGLITKTRAMSGNLLTKDELRQLTEFVTVNDAINYLKSMGGYNSVYQGRDGDWHRGQAEAASIKSLYQDFEKLYRFADANQRLAFEYVFFRYETDILKQCLKCLFRQKKEEVEIYTDEFFEKHICFSIDNLRKATSIQEVEQMLAGTVYEEVFLQMQDSERLAYVDYAMKLDCFYYKSVFDAIKRMKESELKKILLEIYGTQIDWLNIMWIYRSKRFYQQSLKEIYAMIIPAFYRVRKEEFDKLIAASDLTEMNRILSETSYLKGKDAFVKMEYEISYRKIIEAMYQRVSRKYAVSIAPVLKYIYEKEQEIKRLTTIIEGIRYQLPARDIKDLVMITA